ncbi:hypothetical protein ACFX15_011738 [Malus domestica]
MERHHHSQQSNSNLCSPTSPPTTFVQADTNNFRDLVQKLTGLSSDSEKLPITHPARHYPKAPISTGDPTDLRWSPFKLQERKHTMRKLKIKLSLATLHGSQLIPSPVTPLRFKSFSFSSSGSESLSSPTTVAEEKKTIVEKGFYLHLSPLSTKLLVKIRASWIDKADVLSPTDQVLMIKQFHAGSTFLASMNLHKADQGRVLQDPHPEIPSLRPRELLATLSISFWPSPSRASGHSESLWDFVSYSETVAQEHARRSTTSVDSKIFKALQQCPRQC